MNGHKTRIVVRKEKGRIENRESRIENRRQACEGQKFKVQPRNRGPRLAQSWPGSAPGSTTDVLEGDD